ncbi:hypothetical protein HPB51_008691 [Rhipicephalus microplus]|uniref:DDE-1 domain-containing protein n=1 Tax=Rhipicephalus microplus TaxID=6941 RepID=A0A9J6EZX8_RHIMP|nr:hypothetical protein HPB51_008691 [Rhipicephalus microplus]
MDEAMMLEWIRLVWNRRASALLRLRSMLVLDAFRGHLTDAVKRALDDGKMHLAVIPSGMTSTLQPLDVALNKPFKDLEYQDNSLDGTEGDALWEAASDKLSSSEDTGASLD